MHFLLLIDLKIINMFYLNTILMGASFPFGYWVEQTHS